MKADLKDFKLVCKPVLPYADSEIYAHKTIKDLWFVSVDKKKNNKIYDHIEYFQDQVTGEYYETMELAIEAIEKRKAG